MRILAELEATRAPTRNGGPWQYSTLQKTLRNKFYIGRVKFDEGYVRGQHDAVVSDQTFEQAQGILGRKRTA